MLATLTDKPFDSNGWLFEIKWDGYRAIAEIKKDKVALYSRNDLSFNDQFPEIVKSLKKLQINAVFDGEIVILDNNGKSHFQLLQQYYRYKEGILVYYVFDILYFEGYELIDLPLINRKEILKQILSEDSGTNAKSGKKDVLAARIENIRYSSHIKKDGIAFFNEAARNGLEGIMAKKTDSKYLPGIRSTTWLKVKTKMRQEVVIAGYTEPAGTRNKIGSIITGVYDKGILIFTGQAGTGFDEKELENLYNVFIKLETGICPFKIVPKTTTPAHWIKPELAAEVEFTEWTDKNIMRHPVYIGLRTDKDAADVKIEKPEKFKNNSVPDDEKQDSNKKTGKNKNNMKAEENSIILTNPEKIFWPEEKYTKEDLFEYYKKISDYILPYILNKPHSLNRCPDGIEGECFYQKDIDYGLPPGFQIEKIFAESKNEYIDYLVCNGLNSLLYMVNLGCIDIHPWNSTVDNLERPDYAILDLDPLDVDFSDVILIAKETQKILEDADIEGFIKTSGSKGIHIYIPFDAKYTYDQALDFIKIIAGLINMRQPRLTSLERSPRKRQKKVYLDCYQNRIGQTVAAPYCIRPRKGAPVSTPIYWKELDKKFIPADFNIKNIFKRLDSIGDIWKKSLGTGINLKKSLKKLESLV